MKRISNFLRFLSGAKNLKLFLLLLFFSFALFAGSAHALSFDAALTYSAGTTPISVTTGDFNGDGKTDLAVANKGSNNVSILLGNGNGTFQDRLNYAAGTWPRSVTTGDFNRDGKTDLAVANYLDSNVSILLGNGDGTFQAAVNYGAGTTPISITTGDFNRDGKEDLAITGGYIVSIFLGNGDGTFQPAVNYAAGVNMHAVTTGDFNGDGKEDIATANYGYSEGLYCNVSILLGNGDGTFQAAVNYEVGLYIHTQSPQVILTEMERLTLQ